VIGTHGQFLGCAVQAKGAPRPREKGITLDDRLIDTDAEAGAVRQNEIAVANVEGIPQNIVSELVGIHDILAAMAVAGVLEPRAGVGLKTDAEVGVTDAFQQGTPVVESELDSMLNAGFEDRLDGLESTVV